MTYLKKKFAEAGELLLKVREKQFAFFVAPNIEEAQEFIEYFYVGLLQSKKWHISDNNKWKVIEFHFKDDIFSETIEKVLEKNNFTDRRVSLDFEATIIRNLKEQKTSLNKLYRAFQYAFQYNYLFCLFIDELEESSFLEKINDVRKIFEASVKRKAEPLYCILSLSNSQLEILKNNPELFSGESIESGLFYLPVLNKQEIESALNEFPLFRDTKEEIRTDLIEDIEMSDNVLLQLKNAVRKLSVGILPKREIVNKPLQIKKESALKINTKPSESQETSPVKSETIVEKKNEAVEKLDTLFNGLGTRFQRNNFKKIMLAAFHISDENILNHHDLNAWELASVLSINEKDILIALNPFVTNKYIYFDAETQGEINFLNINAFYQWPFLIELSKQNRSVSILFEKINEMISGNKPEIISQQLSNEEWALLNMDDLDFYIDFYSGRMHGLQENLSLIKQHENSQQTNVEQEAEKIDPMEAEVIKEVVKIRFGADKPKLSFIPKEQKDPDPPPQISQDETDDLQQEIEQIAHVDLIEEVVQDDEIGSFDDQVSKEVEPKVLHEVDPLEFTNELNVPEILPSEDSDQEVEFEASQLIEEDIEMKSDDIIEIEANEVTEESEENIEKEIVAIAISSEVIEENIQPAKILPIKIGTQSEDIIAENPGEDQPTDEAHRSTSFKIKPMTIRPEEKSDDEPVVRNKLTFKKKE